MKIKVKYKILGKILVLPNISIETDKILSYIDLRAVTVLNKRAL